MCSFRFKVEMRYACVTISDARALAFENMGTKSARHWNPGFQSLGRPEDVSLSSDPLSVYPVSWSGPSCYFLFRSSRISYRPSLSTDLSIHFRMKYSGFFSGQEKLTFWVNCFWNTLSIAAEDGFYFFLLAILMTSLIIFVIGRSRSRPTKLFWWTNKKEKAKLFRKIIKEGKLHKALLADWRERELNY